MQAIHNYKCTISIVLPQSDNEARLSTHHMHLDFESLLKKQLYLPPAVSWTRLYTNSLGCNLKKLNTFLRSISFAGSSVDVALAYLTIVDIVKGSRLK